MKKPDPDEMPHEDPAKGVATADTPPASDQHAEGGDSESPHSEPGEDSVDSVGGDEADTFPRAHVEKLRAENAKYRVRAQRADDLAARLHEALVAATGRLADPSDLAYDDAHLDDPEALLAAIDELLARKPHLAARTVRGDVGQGAMAASGGVDLSGILRAAAG